MGNRDRDGSGIGAKCLLEQDGLWGKQWRGDRGVVGEGEEGEGEKLDDADAVSG